MINSDYFYQRRFTALGLGASRTSRPTKYNNSIRIRNGTIDIVMHEGGVDRRTATSLVRIATKARHLQDQGLQEGPGTRVIVAAARLIAGGVPARDACHAAITTALTDDADLLSAVDDVVPGWRLPLSEIFG